MIPARPGGAIWDLVPQEELLRTLFLARRGFPRLLRGGRAGFRGMPARTSGSLTAHRRTGSSRGMAPRRCGSRAAHGRAGCSGSMAARPSGATSIAPRAGGAGASHGRTGGSGSMTAGTGGATSIAPRAGGAGASHSRTGGSGSMAARTGGAASIAARTGGSRTTHSRTGGSGSMTAGTGGAASIAARTGGSMASRARAGSSGSMTPRASSPRTDAVESLVPTFPLAAMVGIIKILVIMLTSVVPAVIGVLLFKSPHVLRILLIPDLILWRIPGCGSDHIGDRIRVIRGPPILGAEVVIQ